MAISRARCLPMNFKEKDLVGILKDRSRAREESNLGSSLADVDPMTIDMKVTCNFVFYTVFKWTQKPVLVYFFILLLFLIIHI